MNSTNKYYINNPVFAKAPFPAHSKTIWVSRLKYTSTHQKITKILQTPYFLNSFSLTVYEENLCYDSDSSFIKMGVNEDHLLVDMKKHLAA